MTPQYALPLSVGRKLNVRIAAAEALQLIGAFSDPEWLVKLAPQFDTYREPNGTFWGAYGLRVERQVSDIIAKLRADPWSRQGVAALWDKRWDNIEDKLDYPCTVAFGFTRQPTFTQPVLNMNVTMRSNDVWLGLPYDMFQFTQLFQTVCRVLDEQPGSYTHTAWSMHMYDRDVDASYSVTDALPSDHFDPVGVGAAPMSYREIIHRARTIAREPEKLNDLTVSERWYCDAIHG